MWESIYKVVVDTPHTLVKLKVQYGVSKWTIFCGLTRAGVGVCFGSKERSFEWWIEPFKYLYEIGGSAKVALHWR